MGLPVALQLWTVRAAAARDHAGTLGRVAELGFDGVELVEELMGADRSGAATRAVLRRLGLAAVGCHAHLGALERELDRLIDVTLELGCEHLVCAWLDEPRRADLDAYRDVARSLAGIGERCRQAGVQLVYHHHDFEYARFEGRPALDWLCALVDPALLQVELDTYWVLAGGADPAAELHRFGDRCRLVHVKDRLPDGAPDVAEPQAGVAHRTTEVGTGVLDLPELLAAAEPHVRWCIVEQDVCPNGPFESARTGLANLRTALAERAR